MPDSPSHISHIIGKENFLAIPRKRDTYARGCLGPLRVIELVGRPPIGPFVGILLLLSWSDTVNYLRGRLVEL
jgi:hypothetical protein